MAINIDLAHLRRALRNRNFRIYLAGTTCTGLGNWILQSGLGWLTWELTHSAVWLGAIAASMMVPTLIVGPITGAIVDRIEYLKLLKMSQAGTMLQASLLFIFTYIDFISIWGLVSLTILRGIVTAFNRPARLAFIYNLVGQDDLPAAVSISAIIFNMARFIGPPIGGLLIITGGVPLNFFSSFMTVVIFFATLCLIRDFKMEEKLKSGRGLLRDVLDGFRYCIVHRGIGPFLFALIFTALFARPVIEFFPGFAERVFDAGVSGYVLLMSANGFGAALAGFWFASRSGIKSLTVIVMAFLAVFAAGLMLFVVTDIIWIGIQVLMQLACAGEFRGRVLGVYGIVVRGTPAIGAIIMGGMFEIMGMRLPVLIGGVICLALWALLWRRRAVIAAALESGPVTLSEARSEA
jgi:MFS family permease